MALVLFMSINKNNEVFPIHRKAVAKLMNLSMSQMNKLTKNLVEKCYLIRNDRTQKQDQNRAIIVHLFVLQEHWFQQLRNNAFHDSLFLGYNKIYNIIYQPSVDMQNHMSQSQPKNKYKSREEGTGANYEDKIIYDKITDQKSLLKRRKTKWHVWAKGIVDYWNLSGCRRHLNTATQTYKDALRDTILVLKGKHGNIKKSYTATEIKYAIDNFAQAATDKDFMPRKKDPLKRYGLSEFYYNQYVKDPSLRSSLEYYCAYPPKPIYPMPKEKNKKLTKALINIYTEKRLNNSPVEFTQIDKIKFIEGANKIIAFLEKNKTKVETLMLRNEADIAEVFWHSIATGGNSSKISPAWFASDLSMRRFVEYANENGFMRATGWN